jgi:dTDP-4-amino-4,6-dideoxygalactose transaminase
MKLIGGVFGLDDPSPRASPLPHLAGRAVEFVNARSAIAFALRRLRSARVWLPSYLCDAIIASGPETHRYPIDANLRIASSDWLDDLRPNDAVLIVHYFGFRREARFIEAAVARGAHVIEDAAQALFAEPGPPSACIVYSPRKFVGVPDGGIVVWNRNFAPAAELAAPPREWWLGALSASLLRRDFDRGGAGREWLERFQESERRALTGDFRISDLSAALLRHGIDFATVRAQRIANYRRLLRHLGDVALFPHLDEETVPLGFPLRVANRANVLEQLHAANIYPAIHWPLTHVPEAFADSHRLSREIMTLPCDQRYSQDDMDRMASCLEAAQPIGATA